MLGQSQSLFVGKCWERQAVMCHRPGTPPYGDTKSPHSLCWAGGLRRGRLACVRLRVFPWCRSQWPSGTPQLSGGSFHCSETEGVGSHIGPTAYVGSVSQWTHRPRGPGALKVSGEPRSLPRCEQAHGVHVLWSPPWGSTCLFTTQPGHPGNGEHSSGGGIES